jgi:hypothetical protein
MTEVVTSDEDAFVDLDPRVDALRAGPLRGRLADDLFSDQAEKPSGAGVDSST